jgi:hypothetical protein
MLSCTAWLGFFDFKCVPCPHPLGGNVVDFLEDTVELGVEDIAISVGPVLLANL